MIDYIKKLENEYPRLSKLFRYVASGGIAAFVDLVLLYIFTDFLHIWYLLSAILAFILAFSVSFILQKYWTFKDDSKEEMHKQVIIYFIIAIINLGINTLMMFVSVHYIHLHYMLAQFIVAGLIAFWSFFIYRKFVFKKNEKLSN